MVAFTATSIRRGEQRPCQVDGQDHPKIDLIPPRAGVKNFANSLARTFGIMREYHAGCSKRPSSKAAASEEARRTLRYVEPLSDARTKLEDFFSILLGAYGSQRSLEQLGSLRRFEE